MGYIRKTKNYFKGSYVRKEDRHKLMSIGRCMYCGSVDLLEVEHIDACANGGDSDIINLTVACKKCNTSKGKLPLDVFLAKTIGKRDRVFNGVFSYTGRLARYRKRGTAHDLEEWLIKKIKESRLLHSYYTRIIHNILTEKFRING